MSPDFKLEKVRTPLVNDLVQWHTQLLGALIQMDPVLEKSVRFFQSQVSRSLYDSARHKTLDEVSRAQHESLECDSCKVKPRLLNEIDIWLIRQLLGYDVWTNTKDPIPPLSKHLNEFGLINVCFAKFKLEPENIVLLWSCLRDMQARLASRVFEGVLVLGDLCDSFGLRSRLGNQFGSSMDEYTRRLLDATHQDRVWALDKQLEGDQVVWICASSDKAAYSLQKACAAQAAFNATQNDSNHFVMKWCMVRGTQGVYFCALACDRPIVLASDLLNAGGEPDKVLICENCYRELKGLWPLDRSQLEPPSPLEVKIRDGWPSRIDVSRASLIS